MATTSRSESRAAVLEKLAEADRHVGRLSTGLLEIRLDHEEGHADFWQKLAGEIGGVLSVLAELEDAVGGALAAIGELEDAMIRVIDNAVVPR